MRLLLQSLRTPEAQPTATEQLAGFASRLRFEHLPAELITQTKLSILDTIGVALAGAGIGEGCKQILDYAMSGGASGGSSIWSSGKRIPAPQAALANAAHARALDYDDIIVFPQIHVAACVVPASLAVAQLISSKLNGKNVIAAVALGCEVQSRLAAAIAPFFGEGLPTMLSSQVFGYFSAAAACGNLLDLTFEEMQSAFGLALMHAAGTEEMVVHASDSFGKCLYAGLSNQGGVQSALMASHGVLARGEPLTGAAGLFEAYYNGEYDHEMLVSDLGSHFVSADRCIKAMPGTLVSHAFAEASLKLIEEHKIQVDQIQRVRLHVGPWGKVMCEPANMRRQPSSASAAMNSIPFIVAKAIVNGEVALGDFQYAGRSQPSALAMADRIDHLVDPALAAPDGLEPGILDFILVDGRTIHQRIDVPKGHPRRPLSANDVIHKFRANAQYTERPRPDEEIESIVDRIMNLDALDDIRLLFAAIEGQKHEEGAA
ncbi:MAG: 2-methylcitrate dehydratase PrpD [Bradyrhizobium sp.]|jgi:2-methylcitrate dehydratase PrpD|nr:2-methylcitrate dehydratase PrpD [Bradyrhizobium sp.]